VEVDGLLAQCRARKSFEYLPPAKVDELQAKLQECLDWGEQKIRIAGQTYEVVDKHIRRLDQDLRKFEAELERERQQQVQQTQQVLKAQGKQKATRVTTRKPHRQEFQPVVSDIDDTESIMVDDQLPMNSIPKQKMQNRLKPLIEAELEATDYMAHDQLSELTPVQSIDKPIENFEIGERSNGNEVQAKGNMSTTIGNDGSASSLPMLDIPEMPIDPNEPTYCLCKRVSYGQMIGCDNPNCPVEWYHFECVGVTETVKGKWFCPQCQGKNT